MGYKLISTQFKSNFWIFWEIGTPIFHFPQISRKENQKNSTKILTYNVRLFNKYKWIKENGIENKIYDFLNKENADILCMQEYLNQNIQSKTSYEFKNYNAKINLPGLVYYSME